MKTQKTAAILLTTIVLLTSAQAEQNPNYVSHDTSTGEIDSVVLLGPGVQEIKTNENGQLKSLKVVGQARIPSSLGAAAGVIFATKRAQQSAKQEYIEWIKSHVKSIHNSGTETIVSLEGGSNNGPTESGKSNETDTNSVTTQAEGLVRGLTLIGKKVDPSSQTLSLVYGWSVSNTDLTRQAEAANNRTSGSATPSSSEGVPVNTRLTPVKVTSPAYNQY
jgi:hypothetical protein